VELLWRGAHSLHYAEASKQKRRNCAISNNCYNAPVYVSLQGRVLAVGKNVERLSVAHMTAADFRELEQLTLGFTKQRVLDLLFTSWGTCPDWVGRPIQSQLLWVGDECYTRGATVVTCTNYGLVTQAADKEAEFQKWIQEQCTLLDSCKSQLPLHSKDAFQRLSVSVKVKELYKLLHQTQ
jgi:hypothetical protein